VGKNKREYRWAEKNNSDANNDVDFLAVKGYN